MEVDAHYFGVCQVKRGEALDWAAHQSSGRETKMITEPWVGVQPEESQQGSAHLFSWKWEIFQKEGVVSFGMPLRGGVSEVEESITGICQQGSHWWSWQGETRGEGQGVNRKCLCAAHWCRNLLKGASLFLLSLMEGLWAQEGLLKTDDLESQLLGGSRSRRACRRWRAGNWKGWGGVVPWSEEMPVAVLICWWRSQLSGPAYFTNGAGGEAVGRELQGRVGQMGACREKGKQASQRMSVGMLLVVRAFLNFEMINLKPGWLDMCVFSSTWAPLKAWEGSWFRASIHPRFGITRQLLQRERQWRVVPCY